VPPGRDPLAVHLRGAAAPEQAEQIARVLAIPPKRFTRAVVSYLTDAEAEALHAAPDASRWIGRRDHALLAVIGNGTPPP